MNWIIFIVSVIVGSFIGYLLAKVHNLQDKINQLEIRQTNDWYDLTMRNASNSNKIEYIDEFLKMKFPDMDKIMMKRFAHLLDEQETKE